MVSCIRRAFVCVWVMVVATSAAAQILVGQTIGVTGPVAASVKEMNMGAQLWIGAVNANGGVAGQAIKLVTLDDHFEPDLAAKNARTLLKDPGVIALFLNRGTPHTQAIMPLLQEFRAPLVAPSTGAMVLHQPVHPFVFNVRAPYQREAEAAVMHLATIGIERIAVVHVADSFGADLLEGAQKGFAKTQLKPVVVLPADRDKPDYPSLLQSLLRAQPQAVLWYGSVQAVAGGIKALREAGSTTQVVTASNNASTGFIKALGEQARGVIVTQVFPSERSVNYPMIQEAQALAKQQGLELSPAMLEGYAAAKVLVEGLRRAGRSPTRDSLTKALDSLRKYDMGGLVVSYTPQDHSGLDFVDLSIIGAGGRFQR